ncbi:MAG: hypothetical protein IV105_02960 [Rhizobacter sp.]|nr:hypothetical protein [Rhizobacter sp.]
MSNFQPRSVCGLACFALLASSAAQAGERADATATNADMRYVAASLQRDAQQAQAAMGLLSVPVGERAWVQVGGGQTRQEQTSAARRASVANAGAGYIGEHWQASLAASHRDAGSDFRQTDWDAVLEWRGEQSGLGIDGHHRDARLAGTVVVSTLPSGTATMPVLQRLKGSGIGVHGHVRLTGRFTVYAATMRYDYRISTQQNGASTGGGSTSLLSRVLPQAGPSFVSRDEMALNRSSRVGGSYRFETVTLSGDFIADRVLDEPATVHTVQLKAAFHLSPHWTVTPSVGRTRSETVGGVTFAGLAVSHAW